MDPSYVDHTFYRLDDDTRAALEEVAHLKHDLAIAADAGRDLRSVMEVLRPGLTHSMVESMKGGDDQILARVRQARSALRSADKIPGHRRIGSRRIAASQWAARPSLACRNGRVLATWIEWEHSQGEKVVAAVFEGADVVHPATVVSGDHADCHRPTAIVDNDGRPWVFFSRSDGGPAAIWASCLQGSKWTPPERVSPSQRLAFNQEVTVGERGAIECCWQQESRGRFWIVARRWTEGRWGDVTQISESGANAWDPSIAPLADGSIAYAWSRYDNGSYEVMLRRRNDSALEPERQLTSGTDYALHPSLAATTDGRLWCAFDLLTVQGHGGSGPTRLRPAGRLASDFPESGVIEPRNHDPDTLLPDLGAEVRVIRIDDDGIADTGQVGEYLDISPAGLPRLASTGTNLVVAYRTLRRMPIVSYYWEVGAQQLGPDGWSDPMTFADSDAGLEEPSAAWSAGELHVAWQCDGRRDRNIAWLAGPTGGSEIAFLREHYGEAIWHSTHGAGSVRMACVPVHDAGRTAALAPTADVVTSVRRVEARPWPRGTRKRYTTQAGGKTLTLYWGDLHRHSLISRCTAGDEPSLADYYRYALDLCEYDFWAVTDHAEHSSPYQWWHTQKIADLFLIDGEFVPLYGFEWTGESGHQNVIFGDVPRGAPIFSSRASGSRTPRQLWEQLRARPAYQAITIPHHPGAATIEYDWHYHDPDYLRLVEVFQACRGNYEHNGCFRQFADATVDGTFVVDGLRRGHRFGLIASSDHGYGSSYVGVLAESLDRGSIFEALHARRVLGATSRDIVADMRVGEALLGEEIVLSGPVALDITVRGYRDVARVDVVRNGHVAHSVLPDLELPEGWAAVPLRVEWAVTGPGRDCSGDLRVANAEIVQTPFWSPSVSTVELRRITWAARSAPSAAVYGVERGGVECTVVGPPDACVTVRTAWATLQATLDHLRRGRVPHADDGSGGHVRVQPGTGGLSSLGVDGLSLRWTDHQPDNAWYYVRAFLVDGEMAWSSPIWVDRSPTNPQ